MSHFNQIVKRPPVSGGNTGQIRMNLRGVNSGKQFILGLLSVAMLMAAYAWWHHRQQGKLALDFWGAEVAYQLRHAPEVELWQLGTPVENSGEPSSDQPTTPDAPANLESSSVATTVSIDGRDWPVVQQQEISQARGLVHARHALIVDLSFVWPAKPSDDSIRPDWGYALKFVTEDRTPTVVLLDLKHGWIRSLAGNRMAKLTIAEGLQQVFDENFGGA